MNLVKSLLKKSTQIPEEIFERTKMCGKPDLNLHHFRTRHIFRVIKPLPNNLSTRNLNTQNNNIEAESSKRESPLMHEDINGSYPTKCVLPCPKDGGEVNHLMASGSSVKYREEDK